MYMRMKDNEKEKLQKKFVGMYLEEKKSIKNIAEITGYSRMFVSNLINQDNKVQEQRNKKKIKLYKHKNAKKISVFIPINFWRKIGIDKNAKSIDYVDIQLDELNNQIIIKRHEN